MSLYNAVSFTPREARRRIARWLGGDDLERRVLWGQRLFPVTSRRLTQANLNDPASVLYDYFAIPYESLHTIGQVLNWFDRLGLEYIGSFPPAVLRDYPAMLAHESFGSVDEQYRGPLVQLASKMSRGRDLRCRRPTLSSRAFIQLIWLFVGVRIWCTSARKGVGL